MEKMKDLGPPCQRNTIAEFAAAFFWLSHHQEANSAQVSCLCDFVTPLTLPDVLEIYLGNTAEMLKMKKSHVMCQSSNSHQISAPSLWLEGS